MDARSGAVGHVGGVVIGAVVLVLLVALAVTAWVPSRVWRTDRRESDAGLTLGVDHAVVCDLLAAAFASGASVPRALEALGASMGHSDVSRSLRVAGTALVLGARWEEAWRGAHPDLRELVHALEPAWYEGADPVPVVRRVAESVRMSRDRRARESAARLGVRLVVPLGLCALPAFVLLAVVPALLSAGGAVLGS